MSDRDLLDVLIFDRKGLVFVVDVDVVVAGFM